MVDTAGADAFVDAWKKQIEEGTQAWAKLVSTMGSAAQAPTPDPAQFWRPFLDPGMAAWSKLFSQGPPGPEVMTQWKQFMDQWIAAWSKVQREAMGSEAFGKAMGQYLDQFLALQGPAKKMAEESRETTLQTLGLPSRNQMVAIAQQLMDLDDRMDAVDDRLAALLTKIDHLSKLIEDRAPATPARVAPRRPRTNDQSSSQ